MNDIEVTSSMIHNPFSHVAQNYLFASSRYQFNEWNHVDKEFDVLLEMRTFIPIKN